MKVVCVVEYDGTNFHGSQFHPNVRTVQGEFDDALEKILKMRLRTDLAGRTDTGVHANYQVFSFDYINRRMNEKNFKEAFNSLLPSDMRVKEVWFAPDDFNPRNSAVKRIYHYFIHNSKERSVFLRDRIWWFPYPLDVEKMRQAATYLEGVHDFTSFASIDKDDDRSPVRTIYRIRILKKHDYILLRFEGKSFLRRMVRNMVGTLVRVGTGDWPPEKVKELLELKDRSKAAATAPPHGLYLYKVCFEQNEKGRVYEKETR
ncbi:MAG: tRNA pseudouridine(38-40) synthase TruA [Mesoaciditoga sp.]|uniref:tRNA pseudouridine(38-40) synthase TruA n=1 Tax=Athalassotoga sp. TaxID=2022597 RepID=UPI000CB06B85|nr:MAG: tRNA pseudouridine(38-40) synthase TruA [Mesoaciditoga sp.]PMP80456.1 MAG: tRNA pseudouridine(38-40) synthase TruA [Mesoaciditoga sp.]HEU24714.1 tRNA pseudouridine(38-40) synthase TruA [Mesoaciditoga lauensis]